MELEYPHTDIYQRPDKKWERRLRAANNLIVATDVGHGYSNEADAQAMVDRVVGGEFKGCMRYRTPLKQQ